MKYLPRVLSLCAGLAYLVAPPLLPAQTTGADKKAEAKKQAPAQFLRVVRDAKDQPVALETAVTRYVPATGEAGVVVDLVGVVHVGDRDYYKKLNQLLDEYDVVLYELVAPQGTRPPKGGKKADDPLGFLQQALKTVLGLELQTEQIDYSKKHFVHADLSFEQMAEEVKKRGDDGITLALGVVADLLRQQNLQEMEKAKKPAKPGPDFDLLSLLLDPKGPVKLKRVMAEQLADLDAPAGGLGPTLNTILIADRNKAALKVFQAELAKGKKKVAVFYGAGHMPDFEKRLQEDFGLKRDGQQWLTAWDLGQKK